MYDRSNTMNEKASSPNASPSVIETTREMLPRNDLSEYRSAKNRFFIGLVLNVR